MSRGSRLLMDHVSLSFPTSQTSVYSLWINTDTQIYVCLNWKPLNNPRHLYTRSVWAYLFNFLSLREPLKPTCLLPYMRIPENITRQSFFFTSICVLMFHWPWNTLPVTCIVIKVNTIYIIWSQTWVFGVKLLSNCSSCVTFQLYGLHGEFSRDGI